MHTQFVVALAAITLLSACGNTTSDRALSGGGIGAAVGGVGSALVGGAVLPAVIVGGAVGAAAGGLTNKDQVNLGKPIWK